MEKRLINNSEAITLPPDFEVTEEMQRVVDLVRQKKNLFITGKAGSGKSTLLTYLRAEIFSEFSVYCSFTGVAAINIGGETIHKFFGLLPQHTLEHVQGPQYNPRSQRTMKVLKTLVIDEISMVRADLLDIMDHALRRYGPIPEKPFGGVQLVMFGDLYQLPPIVTGDERDFFADHYRSEFFFDSHALKQVEYEKIELTKVYRQKDKLFVEILDRVRTNNVTESDIAILNQNVIPNFEPEDNELYITLTSTKSLSANINRSKLNELKGTLHTSKAKVTGEFKERDFPTDQFLDFKFGSQILLLNNDQNLRWANGTLARIRRININKDKAVETIAIELASNGEEHLLEPHKWEMLRPNYTNRRLRYDVIGSFQQFPFRLAWSVTIHKSQGKSFENVILDLSHKVFAPGQMYVALSRCRSLKGVKLKTPICIGEVIVDQRVVEYLENAN